MRFHGYVTVFAFTALLSLCASATDPPQYDTGYKSVLMGHSLFNPAATNIDDRAARLYCVRDGGG